jgi:indole-3-glycerol phosphate synthase
MPLFKLLNLLKTNSSMSDILHKILETKREEVLVARAKLPLVEVEHLALESIHDEILKPRGFHASIEEKIRTGYAGVIAEIKQASPSRGVLRTPFDPVEIAISYTQHGAACLSVLTDEQYFKGSSTYLVNARAATHLPVIRKDFMIDAYQIYEARAMGADAILLIVSALSDMQLKEFEEIAFKLGMDVLVEVHGGDELERALRLESPLLGINNRDLKTFEVSIQNTTQLLPNIPLNKRVVTESGILQQSDVDFLRQHQVHAFLVGEAFMRAPSPGEALAKLFF